MTIKNSVIIRHPFLEEMNIVGELLLISFYDKFSFIFQDNLRLGKKIFDTFFLYNFKKKELKRYLIAVRNKDILGTVELNIKSRYPSISFIFSLLVTLLRYYRWFNFLKKFIAIILLKFEITDKETAHITSLAVKPETRNQKIGRKLLITAEHLALKNNCKYIALGVIFRNVYARNLYKKLGYKIIFSIKSTLLLLLMGVDGVSVMKKNCEI